MIEKSKSFFFLDHIMIDISPRLREVEQDIVSGLENWFAL
jgi:hypothetical protein